MWRTWFRAAEYTLEVSSPGLERKLTRPEEYERFAGSLVKVKTFTPVNGNRVWTGRLMGFEDGVVRMDLAAVKQKGKAKKAAAAEVLEIPLEGCGEGEFGGGDLDGFAVERCRQFAAGDLEFDRRSCAPLRMTAKENQQTLEIRGRMKDE